ncbi:MAG: hypothetical protein C3F18_05735 [Nitrosomonadales bacterium]|nr:MAG: hypothetical protein C3F18_05735 [Nitrosomonadales bacterium]
MRFLQLGCLAALLFVWPIPHTIALRHILLMIALLLFGYSAYQIANRNSLKILRLPVALYIALTLWIIINALFISPETSWALVEIKGQWLMGLASLILGVFVALTAQNQKLFSSRTILLMIGGTLFAHVIYADVSTLGTFISTGILPKRVGGLTEGMDKLNYLNNMLIAILFTDCFFRITFHKRQLPFNTALLALAIGLALFGSYIEATRNGMVALLMLIISVTSLYWFENRGRINPRLLIGGILLFLAAAATFGYLSFKADPRWQSLVDTIPIALDTTQHKAWLDDSKYPYPTLPTGEVVNGSNYSRIAWAKEGALLVRDHPLGIGYGRAAFGHGITAKYGEGIIGGHSHSGLIDFAVATGLPGVGLWLAFVISLMYVAVKHYLMDNNPFALILFFIVSGFSARMVVDSVIRDHMLEQFLFLVGFFAFATVARMPNVANYKEITLPKKQ